MTLGLDHKDELQATILSGLVSSDDDYDLHQSRFAYQAASLPMEAFSGLFIRMHRVVSKYWALAGGPPTLQEWESIVSSAHDLDINMQIQLVDIYRQATEDSVPEARFRYACIRLLELYQDQRLQTMITNAAQIHSGTATISGKSFSGYDDTLAYLAGELSSIEHLKTGVGIASSDVNSDAGEVLSNYEAVKTGKKSGVLTGIYELDELTHGLQPGELCVIAGFTGEGKSKVAYNMAYHAAFIQGRNVLFGTCEATREQARLNIVCRHSHHPKFGLKNGIRYNDIKFGTLGVSGEAILKGVVQDMASQEYGRLTLFQMPYRSTPAYVAEELSRAVKRHAVDLIIIDYLGLMTSSIRRASRREELDDLLIASKRLATDGNGGKGVALVSPWQISREAWKEAQKTGLYTRAALSDTSQVEKSPDLIISILSKPGVSNELTCQVLKYRDGPSDVTFSIFTDFASSYISSRQASAISLLD